MNAPNMVIAHPKDEEQTKVLKAFMEALHIKFEIEKCYNKEFVKKVKNSKKQYENGQYISVSKNEIQQLFS